MPALGLEIHINGLDESVAFVNAVAAGLKTDMGPALVAIGEGGSKYFGGVAFDSKGSEFGKPWAELAMSTKIDKSKHWPGRPDLVRTGAMQNGFSFEVQDENTVRLYNALEGNYFDYHQLGTEKMPQRVMIGVTDAFIEMARVAVSTQVAVIIEGARA
jgi:hypothetical protein